MLYYSYHFNLSILRLDTEIQAHKTTAKLDSKELLIKF